MNKTEILGEYQARLPALHDLRAVLEARIQRAVDSQTAKIHSFTGRVKTISSLEQKISRPDRDYADLFSVTDLIGFRFITYSEDVIEPVAKIIENLFEIDFENSVNKLRSEDHTKFGYRSLHYVCVAPDALLSAAGAAGRRLRFEIQIRTNLQHTWAEFEHDLGYKISGELPGKFRRRFSQIASLLELADRELVAVRAEIQNYESRLASLDLSSAEDVELDALSLPLLIARAEVSALDARIASMLGKSKSEEVFYPEYLLRALLAAGFETVHAALNEIPRRFETIEPFIRSYFEFAQRHWNFSDEGVRAVEKGYGLLFIAHVKVLSSEPLLIDKLHKLCLFYEAIDYPNDRAQARAAARELLAELKLKRIVAD